MNFRRFKVFCFHSWVFLFLVSLSFVSSVSYAQETSIAQTWSGKMVFALSNDFRRPTVQSRYIFHAGIAMYDSWAAYDSTASTYLLGNTIGSYNSSFEGIALPVGAEAIRAAREETMSFAMSRLMSHQFMTSPGYFDVQSDINDFMSDRGYDLSNVSEDYQNGGAAELGNYIAAQIISFGLQDGSNEENGYWNQYFSSENDTIIPDLPGNPQMIDPNKWQPITILYNNNGWPASYTSPYLTAEWGNVQPFSLSDENLETFVLDDNLWNVYHNPGSPPMLDTTVQIGFESPLKWGMSMNSVWQSHLDPVQETVWDISPGGIGNVQSYPDSWEDYAEFYNFVDGGDNGTGHPLNPSTGEPYEPNLEKRAEYARSVSVFWSGSDDRLSVPAKWLHIANDKVLSHPQFERNWMGDEEFTDTLAYDVRFYLALGGALHDAAITAWSIKGYYVSSRPISVIRYMTDRGQCSDTSLANYHPAGIPLLEGYIEVVLPGDSLAGDEMEHVGKIKLNTWRGPEYVDFLYDFWDPQNNAGAGWILAENWFPFQTPGFVSPPFAAYVSGNTLISAAAATAMEQMTGSVFFPGGLAQFEMEEGSFYYVEIGPEESVLLQFATYRDAADQCGLSRIWSGVNTPFADIPARTIGQTVGDDAVIFANALFESELTTDVPGVWEFSKVAVFPNPAAKGETINLLVNQTLSQVVVSLANSRGQVIHRQEGARLEKGMHAMNQTDLPGGIYFLHISSQQGEQTMRVVIQ